MSEGEDRKVDITDVDLKEFVKTVYRLSSPQGLGFLHAKQGELSDGEASAIMGLYPADNRIALSMDYVIGRACKMVVFREEGRLFFYAPWYDHTDQQLRELLEAIGRVDCSPVEEHGVACNCDDCQRKRGKDNAN